MALEGSCVDEDVCTQCVSDDGTRHQVVSYLLPSLLGQIFPATQQVVLGCCRKLMMLAKAAVNLTCPFTNEAACTTSVWLAALSVLTEGR